ncbi:MAG: hypothetical protein J0I57_03090 [Hyphomicrobium sp.]|nr:hypothetical protein [Hyphomicrobium sp.]
MIRFVRLLAIWTVLTMTTMLHAEEASEAVIYKNPQCSCCDEYADYLRQNGFKVTVRETHQLAPMSRKAGIPENFEGCHLAYIDGYVVSGHVPVTAIRKLLKERPAIVGIALPGMPLGPPGMGGTKQEPFKLYEIGKAEPKLFMTE